MVSHANFMVCAKQGWGWGDVNQVAEWLAAQDVIMVILQDFLGCCFDLC